jgi:hypothetical protein
VILWESFSPEDQERYYLDLQQDANWVIWCKAKGPKPFWPDVSKNCMSTSPHSSIPHGRGAQALAPTVPQKARQKSGLQDEPRIGASR